MFFVADVADRVSYRPQGFRGAATSDDDVLHLSLIHISSRTSALFKAITQYGLQVPKALLKDEYGTNLAKNKRYDQILQYSSPIYPESFADIGGVLDFHIDDGRIKELFPTAKFPKLTAAKYTFEMSDHLPLWVQIRTDNDKAQLEQIIQG